MSYVELIDEYIELKEQFKNVKSRMDHIRNELINISTNEETNYFVGTDRNISVIEKTITTYDMNKLQDILEKRDLLGLSKTILKQSVDTKEINKLVKAGILTPKDMMEMCSISTEYSLRAEDKI